MSVDRRHVCVSTDVMFVDKRHYEDWALFWHEVVCRLTKLQTGTPGHKWRPENREYKWRTRHSKRNYRMGHQDTNNDRDTGNIHAPRCPRCSCVPVVIYIPCVPVVICVLVFQSVISLWVSRSSFILSVSWSSFVSRSVISSVNKHDVSRQTTSWRHTAQSL